MCVSKYTNVCWYLCEFVCICVCIYVYVMEMGWKGDPHMSKILPSRRN